MTVKSVAKRKYSSDSSHSSGMRNLAKYVGQGSGAALSTYAGFGPELGVAVGGALVDYGFQPTVEDAFDATYPKQNIMGTFKGSFPKAKFNQKSFEAEYASRGYVQRRETNGTMSDPHAVYIGHSTFDPSFIGQTVTAALLRNLMRIGGIPVTDRFQVVPFSGLGVANGLKIEFSVITEAGAVSVDTTYATVVGATFNSIISGMDNMSSYFRDCLNGGNDIWTKPHMLCLYQEDRYQLSPELAAQRLIAKIDLAECLIDLKIHSVLTIQNRTSGAQAVSANNTTFQVDRTDNQPLKGRLFEFKNADPRLRVPAAALNLVDQVPVDGAILIRAAELGADWEDVPPPNFFLNCSKSTNIKLHPGHMKRGFAFYKFNGSLQSLLLKLRCAVTSVVGSVSYAGRALGHCQLLGFEEEMRTPSVNLINLAYERQLIVGASCKMKRPAPLKVGLETGVRNNDTP